MISTLIEPLAISPQGSLSLQSVRNLAIKARLNLISLSETSRVISFGKPADNVRINVYWTTGTVGTCLEHPRQGKTQLFRRNVDLSTLQQIFQNPRLHTGTGYHTRQGLKRIVNESDNDDVCHNLEKEVVLQLKRLDNELLTIQSERAKVQEILDDFEQRREIERKRKAEAEAAIERERIAKQRREEMVKKQALISSQRHSRGKRLDFRLFEGKFVSKWFDETVTSMACGGTATVMFYENGGWAGTSNIPNQLYNKLNGRQKTLPSPKYLALGSQDRYYVEFQDGKSQWNGCDKMDDLLYNSNRCVKTVAFGGDREKDYDQGWNEEWETYFVVFTDGWWSCGGDIPIGLSDILRSRGNRADLECVSLGPHGEYYLKAKNGRAWWGGMTSENLAIISKHKNITFMDFGDDDTFFLRYN